MSNVVRMHPLSSSELSQPATQKVSSINPGFILELLASLLGGEPFFASGKLVGDLNNKFLSEFDLKAVIG